MEIRGKSVVVTGGSRGLGRALGETLGEGGARVVLVAREEGPLDEAVRSVRARGGEVHGVVGDVGGPDAAWSIAARASALVGPVDVLVLNASTLGPVPLSLLADLPDAELARVFEVNVLGHARLVRAVVGSMVLRGGGLVVAISSDAAVEAYPSWGAYGASKAAFDHLVRVWGAELEGTGVRFLSVDPGEMDTAMHRDALPDADPATLARPADVAARIAEIIARETGTGQRIVAARWEARP